MSQDYREMWNELGLDLEAHDMLLDVLSKGYQEVFLQQKNRPKGMEYFDFVISEVHGLRIKELVDAKKEGRIVVGSYCVFVPEELILAVDGISVGLCAGAEFAMDQAEEIVPRNTCALIKSAFGFKLGKVCPYIESTDIIVGENTCDGKKKSYEELKKLIPQLYVMDMPQMKSDSGKMLLKNEYMKFIDKIEELSGKKITLESLKKGIEIVNNKRKALHRLAELRQHPQNVISGLDALLINQISFYDDPIRFTDSVNKLCDELEEKIETTDSVSTKPRILVSGCPMAIPNWKLPAIIEGNNAIIVGEESCVGERGLRNLVDDSSDSMDELIENITERYFKIDCAVFTPNQERLDHIKEMYNKYNADGVLHYNLQFCQPYQIETKSVEEDLEGNNIPVLRIDTDYSNEDVGQIQTRVEAFIERLQG